MCSLEKYGKKNTAKESVAMKSLMVGAVLLVGMLSGQAHAATTTKFQGERIGDTGYSWGWSKVRSPLYDTFDEALAWTHAQAAIKHNGENYLAKYEDFSFYFSRVENGLWASYYGDKFMHTDDLDPSENEPRYCNDWSPGMPGTTVNGSGHFVYEAQDVLFAQVDTGKWVAYFNNCFIGSQKFGIVSLPLVAVREVEVEIPD